MKLNNSLRTLGLKLANLNDDAGGKDDLYAVLSVGDGDVKDTPDNTAGKPKSKPKPKPKPKSLSVVEHRQLGSELYSVRTEIMGIWRRLAACYRKSSPVGRLSFKPERDMDALRSKLDGLFARHYPKEFNTRTYYPGPTSVNES